MLDGSFVVAALVLLNVGRKVLVVAVVVIDAESRILVLVAAALVISVKLHPVVVFVTNLRG